MKNLESQTKTSEVRIINRLQDMERDSGAENKVKYLSQRKR